ncbi:hypothetical protein ABKN59_011697 [Abortiporus biennis]
MVYSSHLSLESQIPQELLDLIIDLIPDERTWSSCALVSNKWRKRSQRNLFQSLRICGKNMAVSSEKLVSFAQAIRPKGRSAHRLVVHITKLHLTHDAIQHTFLAYLLTTLPRLQELHLSAMLITLDHQDLPEDHPGLKFPPKSLRRLRLEAILFTAEDDNQVVSNAAKFLNLFSSIGHLYCHTVRFSAEAIENTAPPQIEVWRKMLEEESKAISKLSRVDMISVTQAADDAEWLLLMIASLPCRTTVTTFYAQMVDFPDTGSIEAHLRDFGSSIEEFIFDTSSVDDNAMIRINAPRLSKSLTRLHTIRILLPSGHLNPPSRDDKIEALISFVVYMLKYAPQTVRNLTIEYTSIPLRFQTNEEQKFKKWFQLIYHIIKSRFETFERFTFVFWQHNRDERTEELINITKKSLPELEERNKLSFVVHKPEIYTSSYPFRRIDECQIQPI